MEQDVKGLDQLIRFEFLKNTNITLLCNNGEEVISGVSLCNGVKRYLNGFKSIKIRKGEKIIIQIHSKKTFIHVIIALLKIGGCPIILPVGMTKNSANMLQKICNDNVDALIVTDNMGKVCIETFLPDIKSPIICVDELYKEGKEIETDICSLNNNIDDVALVIYSSGSTSDPKGVMLTHKGIIKMLEETTKIMKLSEKDILLSWLPIEHTFGLIYFLFLPIYVGCKQVHMETNLFAENPLRWFDEINRYRATVTAGPNFAYQLMLDNLNRNCEWNLSCVKYILNGAEPISKNILHTFLDTFKQFYLKEDCLIPIYGMTEVSGAVVLNLPYREPIIDMIQVDSGIDFDLKSLEVLKHDLICQGKAINGCYVRIVDDLYQELGQMKIGNIQLKGDFLCKGYINKESKDLFIDDWLCTGDIGFLSGENLYIVGRKKDMFFIHGKNIYMRDIEQIIFDKYKVRSAACGENNAMEEKSKIYLFVEMEVSASEASNKKNEVIAFVQREIGIKLSDVIFKNDMFMTQVGKFSKATLLKKYKEQQYIKQYN